MKINKAICLLFILFFSTEIFGHGWLVYPVPRGYVGDNEGSASTQGPCGDVNAAQPYLAPISINANESIQTMWTIGGGHDQGAGPKICRFAIAKRDTSNNQFNQNIIATNISCVAGAYNYTLNLANNNLTGLVYLQWVWLAGDQSVWYSCTKLYIADPNLTVNLIDFSLFGVLNLLLLLLIILLITILCLYLILSLCLRM